LNTFCDFTATSLRLHSDPRRLYGEWKKTKKYMIRGGVTIKFAKCMANPLRIDGDFTATPRRHAKVKKFAIHSGVAIKFAKV